MARFEMLNGTDDFISELGNIAKAKVAREMVTAAAPILVREMESKASAHVEMGDMAASIKASPPRSTSDGISCTVAAEGTGSNGTRNAEKMAYLEFGTYKQTPTPVVTPAVNAAEPKVLAKMQQVYEEKIKI